ncbi:toxin-antitoxin system HicB family antitoxin [Sphingomonas sp.]|uniref:toxin-antitoxin system HicB family antitoxin n=1 Tax=Sphingomonas sp. TaxID=28214 RepID=UPI001DCFC0BB|nr:toxin-antitoxin system HicB family antitoxin [Sphingomonas sp.]MBX9797664.1 toxin-antitoxin system HicB family antitoxin [Sphingomonas sp.]
MSNARKPFPLRLDPLLHAAVERTATGDLRSVNAQIEVLLREALARRGVKLAAPVPTRRGRPPKEAPQGGTRQ